MVRLRDAHSWVEVFVDGAGWITLDPSPRAGVEVAPLAASTTLWLDSVRMSWYRYVVGFGLHDQLTAAETVRRAAWSWSAALTDPPAWREIPRPALAVLAVLVVGVAALGWRRARGASGAAGGMPVFYARALRVLARQGVVPAPGETARELAQRTQGHGWGPALARLTVAYERVRFGGAVLTPSEAAEVEAALAVLAARGA
jgi:hypothetical protein